MTTTVAQATQIEAHRLSILVNADYSQSFYQFLQSAKVPCSPPSGAIFRRRRAFIDAEGKRQIEEEAILYEIVAAGTLDDFTKWLGAWTAPTPKK